MAADDLGAVAFPTLDEAQIARLGRCAGASFGRYRAGQKLFEVGERETNRRGVFAAGDVRAGSVKRVASPSARGRWRCSSCTST
jgi:hypothetical protein